MSNQKKHKGLQGKNRELNETHKNTNKNGEGLFSGLEKHVELSTYQSRVALLCTRRATVFKKSELRV